VLRGVSSATAARMTAMCRRWVQYLRTLGYDEVSMTATPSRLMNFSGIGSRRAFANPMPLSFILSHASVK